MPNILKEKKKKKGVSAIWEEEGEVCDLQQGRKILYLHLNL